MNIMQGDGYSIPLTVKMDNNALTDEDLLDLEVSIGPIRKSYAEDELYYDSEAGLWNVPITQQETQSLCGSMLMQVRVKMLNGDVVGTNLGRIDIQMSLSKEVL